MIDPGKSLLQTLGLRSGTVHLPCESARAPHWHLQTSRRYREPAIPHAAKRLNMVWEPSALGSGLAAWRQSPKEAFETERRFQEVRSCLPGSPPIAKALRPSSLQQPASRMFHASMSRSCRKRVRPPCAPLRRQQFGLSAVVTEPRSYGRTVKWPRAPNKNARPA